MTVQHVFYPSFLFHNSIVLGSPVSKPKKFLKSVQNSPRYSLRKSSKMALAVYATPLRRLSGVSYTAKANFFLVFLKNFFFLDILRLKGFSDPFLLFF